MQQAIILHAFTDSPSHKELNDSLESGWEFVSATPMPSSNGAQTAGYYCPTCLVILETRLPSLIDKVLEQRAGRAKS